MGTDFRFSSGTSSSLFFVPIFFIHCGSWILIERVPNILPQILHCTPTGVEGAGDGEGAVICPFVGDLGYKEEKNWLSINVA